MRREPKNSDGMLVLVEASKLSLTDKFMVEHSPRTGAEKALHEKLIILIKKGLKDFWRPICDPSFDDNGEIRYKLGSQPAVGKSYNWWEEHAKKFNPRRKSRLGTKTEYIAFLGVLIKNLLNEGWSVADAWNEVCNDSRDFGHYCNSKDAKHGFEPTGSREVYGLFDLSNTYKILAEDNQDGGFWLAGGAYNDNSDNYPLMDIAFSINRNRTINNCVGWIVLKK